MSAMRYVGNGSFLIGVPARDLSAEEAGRYAETIADSGLYEPMVEPVAAVRAAASAAPTEQAETGEGQTDGAVGRKRGKGE